MGGVMDQLMCQDAYPEPKGEVCGHAHDSAVFKARCPDLVASIK